MATRKKAAADEVVTEAVNDHAVTLVFTVRENGELRLLKIVPRSDAVAYAEEFGAILIDAERYMPHLA